MTWALWRTGVATLGGSRALVIGTAFAIVALGLMSLSGNTPGVNVDRTHHEFPATDPEIRTRFVLSNHSREIANIAKIAPSCGCISAIADTQQLRPGTSANIAVTMPKPSIGTSRGSIRIELRNHPAVLLTVVSHSSSSEPRIVSLAPTVVRLIDGKSPSREIRVTSLEPNPESAGIRNSLRVERRMEGIVVTLASEVARTLPDPRFAQLERVYRIERDEKPGPVRVGELWFGYHNASERRRIPVEVY